MPAMKCKSCDCRWATIGGPADACPDCGSDETDLDIDEVQASIFALRKWQRHWLLRQYGEDGKVLADNIELSGHLDRVIDRLCAVATPS